MPPAWRAVALTALVLISTRAAAGQPLPVAAEGSPFYQPTPELMKKLERHHVVLTESEPASGDSRVGIVEALVLFDQPRETVMRMLIETDRQIEYRPELKNLQVIESDDHSTKAEYHLSLMLVTVAYRARQEWDTEAGRVWWSLDPEFPNGIRRLDGLWELRELDENHTLGHFSSRIDLGSALPAWLQDYATRKKLPESMEHVAHWVDSGGRWRP